MTDFKEEIKETYEALGKESIYCLISLFNEIDGKPPCVNKKRYRANNPDQIDKAVVLGSGNTTFLVNTDRENINKGVAHLTENLTVDPDSEVDLIRITTDSVPALERLISELKKLDTSGEAKPYINKTEKLIERIKSI